jgi:signal transduction histidine kinase
MRAVANKAGVQVNLRCMPPDLRVETDAQRITQVLANLLSNATKFSSSGQIVEVSVTGRNDRVCISFTDHGPGIPEHFRHRVFEKFAQAGDPNTRRRGGTGLGLTVSRQIVERLKGTISFQSEPGVSTTFTVEFPMSQRAGQSV